MARRWSLVEERKKFSELQRFYVRDNKTIGEIGKILGIAEQTVFQRLVRLGIPSAPERKTTYVARRRKDITIPKQRTAKLAEFFGIMLGDGRLSPPYQIIVTLGTKELSYAKYVVGLISRLFGASPKIGIRNNGYKDVYLGSTELVSWLQKEGLVHNKVLYQVGVPGWIFTKKEFMIGFLRGFFDTDGSVYRLRFGIQISFTNKSQPLLQSTHRMMQILHYYPSKVNGYRIYLTRKLDILKFFKDVKPENSKHSRRFEIFVNKMWAGRPVGGGG